MSILYKTWDLTLKVRVTTMAGWEPDTGDVERWLDDGGALLLVSVENVQEAKA